MSQTDPVTDLLNVITTNTPTSHASSGANTTGLSEALDDAVEQLTKPRLIHTEITDDAGHITGIHTETHPPLLDLLEHGLGSSNRGRSSGIRIPIDAEALEMWAQIRDQVRLWLRALAGPWKDDLKIDLQTWQLHHETALQRGHITYEQHRDVTRLVETWVDRIDTKYDPAVHLEFVDKCPAVLHTENGEQRRCGALKWVDAHGDLHSAIDLNLTHYTAHCRVCGTRWDGERGLRQLRWEANHYELERLIAKAQADPSVLNVKERDQLIHAATVEKIPMPDGLLDLIRAQEAVSA